MQPSLARVFELFDIAPWSDDEAMDFYRKSFDAGGAKVADSDMHQLVRFTGGLPVLAHEIGDAVVAYGPGSANRRKRSQERHLDRGRLDRLETVATPGVQGHSQ